PNNGGTQLVFDNVILDATPVPEPSSLLGFITLGGLMLGSAVRLTGGGRDT
ncbi:MAG: PEP-CTERM sorting domain-containing protein, partial [Microcystis panniformis]